METQFERTALILGENAIETLAHKSVLLFGVGGVGSFASEALARAGVGKITLCDSDVVSESNINRQIIALHSTVGRNKTEVMRERIADINPAAVVAEHVCFFGADTAHRFDFSQYDYIIDAIDSVTAKLLIIALAQQCGTRVISSMGTGNKLDPSQFQICDISKTHECPLARVMRRELKARGIAHVDVLFSPETPRTTAFDVVSEGSRRAVPGSVSFVPSVAGLMIAGHVIRALAE